MSREHTEPSSGRQPRSLQERLAAFARYAALVRAQYRALEEEDVTTFSALAEDRQEIQEVLDGESRDIADFRPVGPEEEGMVRGARAELAEALALDKEIRRKLVLMRGQIASQFKDISSRKGSAREYLSRDVKSEEGQRARLNVRL